MKKKYEKPIFVFESFSLDTNIAGNCDEITDAPSYNQCGLEFGADVVFLSTETGCSENFTVDDGEYNGICYHVPTDQTNLFNS